MASAAAPFEPAHQPYRQRSTNKKSPLRQQATRSCSQSPRKRQVKQPLTIRLDLTRTQMDRVTEAITQRVDDSPAKLHEKSEWPSAGGAQGPVNAPFRSHPRAEKDSITIGLDTSPARPVGGKITSGAVDVLAQNLAERRQNGPLLPVTVKHKHGPLDHGHTRQPRSMDSSLYQYSISPNGYPHLDKESPFDNKGEPFHNTTPDSFVGNETSPQPDRALLEMYEAWGNIKSPKTQFQFPHRHQSLAQRPGRSRSSVALEAGSNSDEPAAPLELLRPVTYEPDASGGEPSPLFSPLSFYFRDKNASSSKKGEKVMIGRNGWLERPTRSSNDEKKTQSKRAGFIDSIKKVAREMTADLHPTYRKVMLSSADLCGSQPTTSLSPREQSLLYCELEFHITAALNEYIISELSRGHVLADFLKEISDRWLQQGRPRVIGFRYDIETQIELVCLHVNHFNFYGRRQSNPVEIAGLLDAMKCNARTMRVRTFCHPDSVIAKQLIDSQSLFNLISVSNAQQLALEEIAHFFKTIIERESTQRG